MNIHLYAYFTICFITKTCFAFFMFYIKYLHLGNLSESCIRIFCTVLKLLYMSIITLKIKAF